MASQNVESDDDDVVFVGFKVNKTRQKSQSLPKRINKTQSNRLLSSSQAITAASAIPRQYNEKRPAILRTYSTGRKELPKPHQNNAPLMTSISQSDVTKTNGHRQLPKPHQNNAPLVTRIPQSDSTRTMPKFTQIPPPMLQLKTSGNEILRPPSILPNPTVVQPTSLSKAQFIRTPPLVAIPTRLNQNTSIIISPKPTPLPTNRNAPSKLCGNKNDPEVKALSTSKSISLPLPTNRNPSSTLNENDNHSKLKALAIPDTPTIITENGPSDNSTASSKPNTLPPNRKVTSASVGYKNDSKVKAFAIPVTSTIITENGLSDKSAASPTNRNVTSASGGYKNDSKVKAVAIPVTSTIITENGLSDNSTASPKPTTLPTNRNVPSASVGYKNYSNVKAVAIPVTPTIITENGLSDKITASPKPTTLPTNRNMPSTSGRYKNDAIPVTPGIITQTGPSEKSTASPNPRTFPTNRNVPSASAGYKNDSKLKALVIPVTPTIITENGLGDNSTASPRPNPSEVILQQSEIHKNINEEGMTSVDQSLSTLPSIEELLDPTLQYDNVDNTLDDNELGLLLMELGINLGEPSYFTPASTSEEKTTASSLATLPSNVQSESITTPCPFTICPEKDQNLRSIEEMGDMDQDPKSIEEISGKDQDPAQIERMDDLSSSPPTENMDDGDTQTMLEKDDSVISEGPPKTKSNSLTKEVDDEDEMEEEEESNESTLADNEMDIEINNKEEGEIEIIRTIVKVFVCKICRCPFYTWEEFSTHLVDYHKIAKTFQSRIIDKEEEESPGMGTVDDLEASLGHKIPGRVDEEDLWEDYSGSESGDESNEEEEQQDSSEDELDLWSTTSEEPNSSDSDYVDELTTRKSGGKKSSDSSDSLDDDDPDWCDGDSREKYVNRKKKKKNQVSNILPGDTEKYLNVDDLMCLICKRTYPSRYNLFRHFKCVHLDKDSLAPNGPKIVVDVGDLTCRICKQVLSSKCSLMRHFKRVHQGGKVRKAGDVRNNFANLQRQEDKDGDVSDDSMSPTRPFKENGKIDEAKKLDSMQKSRTKPYCCFICGKRYTEEKELDYHLVRKHRDYSGLTCSVCKKPIEKESALEKHLKPNRPHILLPPEGITMTTELNDIPVGCAFCEETFLNLECLNFHIKRHDRESSGKRYRCTLCPKSSSLSFVKISALEKHSISHFNKMPCPRCRKNLIEGSLIDHVRVCKQLPKLFQCPVCYKLFGLIGTLSSHLIKIHENCAVVCFTCGKVFPSQQGLKDHRVNNRCLAEFPCEICNRVFSSTCGLYDHFKHHPKWTPAMVKVEESQETDPLPPEQVGINIP